MTAALALIASSPWTVCTVGCMVIGVTIAISCHGEGTLHGDIGATTGGRSFLVVAEVREEDSSVVPEVGLVILAK